MELLEPKGDIVRGVLDLFYQNNTQKSEFSAKNNGQKITYLNLFYYNDNSSYFSGAKEGEFINIDIKLLKRYLLIKSYAFRASGNVYNSQYHPVAWTLYGAVKSKWYVLDKLNISQEPFNSMEVRNFTCAEGIFNKFRISFAPHDVTNQTWGLSLRQFDIFGYLLPKSYVRLFELTNKMCKKHVSLCFVFSVLILR